MSAPQSSIYICSGVRLNNRYDHTIYFASRSAQQQYFAGKVVRTFTGYTFLRKTWDIKVNATMEEARTWSYLYFHNDTGKYWYYFINQVEYVNDSTVRLMLELDVMQSYETEYTLHRCFVERQHVADDTPGANTVEEDLETGELVDTDIFDDDMSDLCILVLASINPNYAETETPVQALAGSYDGVFSGLKIWAVDMADWAAWGNQIDKLSTAGFTDGIINMWMYPKRLVQLGGENTWDDDVLCKTVSHTSKKVQLGHYNTNGMVGAYLPRNQKLLCYPYNMLYVSNNHGGSAVYRYERFKDGEIDFYIYGSPSPDAALKMVPVNYNGGNMNLGANGENHECALTLSGFPSCAWDADIYKLWLAQNQNQHLASNIDAGVKIGAGLLTAIGGIVTKSVGLGASGAVTAYNGAQQIGMQLAQKADMAIQPPQARGNFSANINVAAKKLCFTLYNKCVSEERAAIIDDYFDLYGYKINRVQVPQRATRPFWTYVKTIGCHISGNFAVEDLAKIEAIYDKGITFWKNGDKIGEYDNDNTVYKG